MFLKNHDICGNKKKKERRTGDDFVSISTEIREDGCSKEKSLSKRLNVIKFIDYYLCFPFIDSSIQTNSYRHNLFI